MSATSIFEKGKTQKLSHVWSMAKYEKFSKVDTSLLPLPIGTKEQGLVAKNDVSEFNKVFSNKMQTINTALSRFDIGCIGKKLSKLCSLLSLLHVR